MPTTFHRFSGCIIGQCLGDALGFPVEGYSPIICSHYVNNHLLANPMQLYGRGEKYPFGQYTDDSQLARELLISLRNNGGIFSPQDYANRIGKIFKERRIVGRGRATSKAASNINIGVGWENAGTPAPSAGNGSAMRAAPVGLIFGPTKQMIEIAHQQSWITHQDPRCSAGSIAIAGAVALLQFENSESTSPESKSTLDPVQFTENIATWVQEYDSFLANAILNLPETSKMDTDQAYSIISCRSEEDGQEPGWYGISPYVTESVLWSLYSFLRSPENYWKTICTAIQVGGDVDTTAAMAGAISGSYLGLNGIPLDPALKVTDKGRWNYLDLIALSEESMDISSLIPVSDPLIKDESLSTNNANSCVFGMGGMQGEWLMNYYRGEDEFRKSFHHLRKYTKKQLQEIRILGGVLD
jgi:ADP-ribosylglycohydrolase